MQVTTANVNFTLSANPVSAKKSLQQPAQEAKKDSTKNPLQANNITQDPNSPKFRQLQQLKQIDREVRLHEQAHLAAAGQFAQSGASFTFRRGSDGQNYAVAGEVKIDTAPVANNPQATLAKMKVVQAAALAPAKPSAQDRAIAAQAAQTASQAQIDIQLQANQQASEGNRAPAKNENISPSEAYSANAQTDANNQTNAIIDLLV